MRTVNVQGRFLPIVSFKCNPVETYACRQGVASVSTYPGLTKLKSAIDGVVLSLVQVGGGGVVPPAKSLLLAGDKNVQKIVPAVRSVGRKRLPDIFISWRCSM